MYLTVSMVSSLVTVTAKQPSWQHHRLTPCESSLHQTGRCCNGHLTAKVRVKGAAIPPGSFSPVGHLWPGESGLKARPELASSALPTILQKPYSGIEFLSS